MKVNDDAKKHWSFRKKLTIDRLDFAAEEVGTQLTLLSLCFFFWQFTEINDLFWCQNI